MAENREGKREITINKAEVKNKDKEEKKRKNVSPAERQDKRWRKEGEEDGKKVRDEESDVEYGNEDSEEDSWSEQQEEN